MATSLHVPMPISPDVHELGVAVSAMRRIKRISQAQLAELVGTNQRYISRIELGKVDPPYTLLCRLASALGFESVEEFLQYAKMLQRRQ